uniref:MADS-box protein 19 n=1 Tax=Cunninghamia lanceolata TaxID=28977 RepID=A0A8F3BZ36_CUNLA|nr:MADS-box protein 19 [Cunninghamia lanceolata]
MARERIEIKKIEKTAARHVTFCKRRRGLLKKAQELSILCEADVGVIIFSSSGKLFEYASSSMKMVLEKYSKDNDKQPQVKSAKFENQDLIRINQEIEDMKQSVRRMHGEDLQTLTLRELKKLERQLQLGLRQIRSKKNEQIFKEASDLEEKVAQLMEGNTKFGLQFDATHCCSSAQIALKRKPCSLSLWTDKIILSHLIPLVILHTASLNITKALEKMRFQTRSCNWGCLQGIILMVVG